MTNETRLQQLREQHAALKTSLYSGALSVRHGDKQVMYRSVDELRKAQENLEEEIAKLEGHNKKRVFYANTRRGY